MSDSSSTSQSDNDSWDDWQDEDTLAQCLFCSIKSSVPDLLQHLKSEHEFDLQKAANGLDEYGRMRLINWIRLQHDKTNLSAKVAQIKKSLESDDTLLKPTMEDDALLFVDWHEEADVDALESALQKIKDLEIALADYKEEVRKTFLDAKVEDILKESDVVEEEELDGYFKSYAGIHIHEQMLRDRPRTEAYRDFFYLNKDLFKDKVVLDVGCGTGILSMFAAKAGAKRVFAVDNSTIITKARENVKENGLQDVITLFRGKIEELELPEKVDVIVSEWMGYFLLFEGMLDSVLVARDKWLKPGGFCTYNLAILTFQVMPSRAEMHLAAISDEAYFDGAYNYWNDVYGFKMTSMRDFLWIEGQVEGVNGKVLASESVEMIGWDLNTCSVQDLDFESTVELHIREPCVVHAFCGSFDTIFSANQPGVTEVVLSTMPVRATTHWKQTVFYLKDRFTITDKDQRLRVKMKVMRTSPGARDLKVEYEVDLFNTENGVCIGSSLQHLKQSCFVG